MPGPRLRSPLSGTAVASADESGAGSGQRQEQVNKENQTTAETGKDTPAKDTSGSSDFGEVFGSFVTDKETGESSFQFAQALKALVNVTAFGTAVAGVLGVIVTLSTKVPQVLEIFGIEASSKK